MHVKNSAKPALTAREAALLKYVEEFIAAKSYPPSHRQIAGSLGYNAVKTVQQLLSQLEKKGYIARDPGISRGLRLLQTRRAGELVEK